MPDPTTNPNATSSNGVAAQVIASLAQQAVPRHTALKIDLPLNGVAPRLVWPDKTITDLEGTLPNPLRKRATAKFGTTDSFCAYVNRHKTPNTHIVGDADENGGSFAALLDYHGDQPFWCEHTAKQELQPTPEWVRWLGKNRSTLDQRAFAEFIEDNASDVIVPDGEAGRGFPTQGELLSVALTLQVKTDVQFGSSVRLSNGQVQIGYVENIQGTHGGEAKLAIQEKFAIGIAPFRGVPKYEITCRLRYRAVQGKATFAYEIEKPHKIVEHAFNDMRAKITQSTGIEPLIGQLHPQSRPAV